MHPHINQTFTKAWYNFKINRTISMKYILLSLDENMQVNSHADIYRTKLTKLMNGI